MEYAANLADRITMMSGTIFLHVDGRSEYIKLFLYRIRPRQSAVIEPRPLIPPNGCVRHLSEACSYRVVLSGIPFGAQLAVRAFHHGLMKLPNTITVQKDHGDLQEEQMQVDCHLNIREWQVTRHRRQSMTSGYEERRRFE